MTKSQLPMDRFAVAAVLSMLLLLRAGGRGYAATPEEVNSAVDKAKAWLYAHQQYGNWEAVQVPDKNPLTLDIIGSQWSGQTALVAYALISAGERPKDPRLAAAIDFLAKSSTHGTYALGVRCLLWGSLDLDAAQHVVAERDCQLLLANMRMKGEATGLDHYFPPDMGDPALYDHSGSQYAALGLWTLERAGFEIPRRYWSITQAAWQHHENSDGSWSYVFNGTGEAGKETASMTAAGVATLLITDDRLNLSGDCRGTPPSAGVVNGLRWLSQNFDSVFSLPREYLGLPFERYTLFGISRIGAASGLKYFDNIDWYQRGSDYLISTQIPDGSWLGRPAPPAETAFGILFLTYGRAPVVLNKLQYNADDKPGSAPAHWDQRREDCANFVAWMGKQLEERFNWQSVNLSQPADELHDAPIIFICGDKKLSFAQADKEKLRLFVQQGGMIVGNSDCNSMEFARSFRALGSELFPTYEFRKLPKNHPVFSNEQYHAARWRIRQSVVGLSNGVREFMLLPASDLSRAFQGRNSGLRPESYELLDNIILYAVDKKGLREKGATYIVKDNPQAPIDRSIKVARLQYAGNWDPEPGGWPRLAAIMHNQFHLGVTVEAVKLGEGKLIASIASGPGSAPPAGYTIAHLTGTTAFQLSDAQRRELQNFLASGGTLVIDAAGGSTQFADAAHNELMALLGPGAAKTAESPVPLQSPLYSLANATITRVVYRDFARQDSLGALDRPRLYGLQQQGRTVAYFSREDISAGLVGEPVDGIVGYDPESATAIMRNIILFTVAGKSSAPSAGK
jgi:hypothetical protein